MRHKTILFWLLACVALNRACSLVPDVMFDPFPLYDIDISVQYYVYGIANHGIVMVLVYLLCQSAYDDRLARLGARLFVIETLSLIDFLIIYEHAWFTVASYGVEFTDLKVLIYAYLIITWRQR